MLSTLPYGNAVPFSYEAQVRPRQGLSPCWFNTLAIALATRFHLVDPASWKLAATWENLHPHGKMCTHNSKNPTHLPCGDKIPSCRGHVQVENLHPHGKTCTHIGKCAPTKGLERSSFRTDPSSTCLSHCGRPAYGSMFERWHPADTVPES